jgi:peptide chain release factor 1
MADPPPRSSCLVVSTQRHLAFSLLPRAFSVSSLPELLAEYAEVEQALSDPAVHADQTRARALGRRFAQLAPIRAAATELDSTRADRDAARELATEDASFAIEADALDTRIEQIEARLRDLLVPKDPNDSKDVIL